MAARIVFMGSPTFSLPSLEYLSKQYTIVGVVTQPDRPAGRGRRLTTSAVKQKAIELSLPVIQPVKLKEPEVFDTLQEWSPDVIVVAAYGQILRQNVLDLPRYGCINIHASLLPRWRGASPIQFAILEGDAESGVTIMRMEAGLDTGPILSQCSTPIKVVDTAGTLGDRLAVLGAELLAQTLPDYLAEKLQPIPQEDSLATYARLLKKEDGQLDFSQPATRLDRQVRAFDPWPGAFMVWQGQPLKVLGAHVENTGQTVPGRLINFSKKPAVGTASGLLVLDEVQPAGKKPMQGSVFLHGAHGWG